ncbi:MAG: response regulator [SAR324 cluster bacterium]|nr:response regulator [SAR324 cluster bacterium]
MKTTGNKLNILVVDDDENIRMILEKTLTKLGHHVSQAKSAEEALATLEHSYFNVVITDIQMEEMTGIELLKEIKELNSIMQIFIITAHSNLPNVIQCMKNGAYDYFEKPLDLSEIITSVNEAARRVERWNTFYKKYSQISQK